MVYMFYHPFQSYTLQFPHFFAAHALHCFVPNHRFSMYCLLVMNLNRPQSNNFFVRITHIWEAKCGFSFIFSMGSTLFSLGYRNSRFRKKHVIGVDCGRAANVVESSEQIVDESPTLQGSRSRLWTSHQRCREVGADCGRAANVVESSEQIVDESPTLQGSRSRLWTGGCKFLFMLPYLQIILIFAIESN